MKIYIAGPYTRGDVAENVHNAIMAAEEIVKLGHIPYIPHLTHFWHLMAQHDIDFWYEYDLVWLTFCDALVRLPGDSHGADEEVETAESLGKPIFTMETLPKGGDAV